MPAELLPVRLSHILGYSGVGAIVRSANYLLVVQDIRDWTDRHGIPGGRRLPYVERVRAALEITEELREPPVASELDNGLVEGVCIPARGSRLGPDVRGAVNYITNHGGRARKAMKSRFARRQGASAVNWNKSPGCWRIPRVI